MYSKLLDAETYVAVVKSAPDVTHPLASDARLVLTALQAMTLELPTQVGMDGKPYWSCLLGELRGLPEGLSAKRTGLVCRELGLVMWRRNTGYMVAWSGEQLKTLLAFFQMS